MAKYIEVNNSSIFLDLSFMLASVLNFTSWVYAKLASLTRSIPGIADIKYTI